MDRLVGEVLSRILVRAHLLRPGFVAKILFEEARPLGVRDATVYLADLEQDYLRSMPRLDGRAVPALRIDSTLAGRSYRALEIQYGPVDEDALHHVWLPLMDGSERLGVLELVVGDVDEETLNWCRALASLAGLMVVSKAHYSDIHAQVRRSQRMALQAEMVWAFMAPPTFATDEVLVACGIRPMYGVGGDAYDYSLLGDHLHVSILDAVGHDLASGLIASVALASCRNTRRGGGDLADMVTYADHAIASQFGRSRFATALLCDLDIETGLFRWVPCGHPPPLLIRENKVVKELFHRPRLPLGLVSDGDGPSFDESPPVYTEQLQPRDRLLLYTDGVVEARAADGSLFGVRRLSDFVIRHSTAGIPAPETLRRLNRAVIDFQHGRLGDDATTVLVQWRPEELRLKFEF
ncbi:serine/threonine-protein phosphatase [Actinoallomurus spadix]|uniref:PP2C family protein-serine/threonine phosphatase n=1 Tax=Actinoallomurus spadix TaxID=79912 RepID=A0ABN0XHZ9_9ACTN|nr:PP2C family protein-serine/threonine phosphatase [Actinoallomurus spadix]MCO5987599.1 serine/threonine-protein phosphatase [Actinoallomurus spadix]